MNIGLIILQHRKAAGLSRVQLAERAGVGKTVIFKVEHGDIGIRLDSMLKIMHVLNIRWQVSSPFLNKPETLDYETE